MTQEKKKLSFWQIWNMSFGFLGIQFGFALQGGFMSRIFQTLGAEKDAIPFLWIAAPLTGLLVQPIVGYLSDRTWHPRFGRRKPFFFFGAVLSTIALFFAPYSAALWMAAGALWILDASINISMEPFRALVADKLPESQRSYGFVVQTLIIGIGTWVASNLPWLMTELGAANTAAPGVVPDSVKYAFGIGAFVLFTSILYTILNTEEYPPEDLDAFEREKESKKGFFKGMKEVFHLDKLEGDKAIFKDGHVQEADAVILCTGYLHHFPFLTEDLKLKTGNRLYPPKLYKGVVWQDNHKLMYLGMQDQFHTFNMFDCQAWFARDVIMGKIKIPNDSDIDKDIDKWVSMEEKLENPDQMIDFQTEYTKELHDLSDYPKIDFELIRRTFKEWEHHKVENIMTYRNKSFASPVTGSVGPKHHTDWEIAMDDSLKTFLDQPK